MAVGPPLGGSSLAFVLAITKDVFLYLKRKRRRVRELLDDFKELDGEVIDLGACWNDIKRLIDNDPQNIRNQQYDSMGRKVSRISAKFDQIKMQYEALCAHPEPGDTTAESAPASIPITGNETNAGEIRTQSSRQAQNDEYETRPSSTLDNIGEQKIWTRNFFKLARLDKDIMKLLPKVSPVKAGLLLDRLTHPAEPKIVEEKGISLRGYVLPSQQKILDELLQYLSDPNKRRIGICGPPGIGKSYLLKNVNESFEPSSQVSCKYDYIIWIEAPEPGQGKITETIQEEIMARLKLTKGENKYRNAEMLSTKLCKKKYLLLIDDFHPLVKLEEIGIREGQVVVAANSFNALGDLKLDETIEIPTLSKEEARDLIKHNIEGYDALSSQHKEITPEVVKHLGKLPGVIISLANYLNRNRDYGIWKALKERSQMDVLVPELLGLGPLIGSYKTLYESLKGDEFKNCLLYAALFPSRFKICRNTLVECWKSENFLRCTSQSLSVAQSQGKLIITELESNMLFERCRDQKYVKMSQFFRKIAFHIRFPNEKKGRMYARSDRDHDLKLDEEWKGVTRLSFVGVDNILLPESPKCFDISTLFLQLNPSLTTIGPSFFTNMKQLRVLDLHGSGIGRLPHSISNLGELRSLYVNDCEKLTHLPTTVVQLKKLEILDISGTSIQCLPAGDLILKLVSLRCLRFTIFPAEILKPILEPSPNVKGFLALLFKTPPNNQTWVVFPPNMHMQLLNLEKVTVGIRGRVTDKIRDIVKAELAQFGKGEEFFDLIELSEGQTVELSNATDQTLMPPSIIQIPGAPTESESNNIANRSRTMPREDRGKEVVVPQTQRKMAKSASQGGGIAINEPQEAIPALTDSDESDDERDGNHSMIGGGSLHGLVGETSSRGGDNYLRKEDSESNL